MRLDLRNSCLSAPRYHRYLTATSNNPARSKRLYHANIRLAQAFHPLLSQFEVVLRNTLNTVLTTHFGDSDWIINQKTGFMSDRSLGQSKYYLRTCVQKCETKLMNRMIPVTSGKIVSDQTFGFWLAFFLPHHYTLVGGQPIQIFPHKPAIENRAGIYQMLDDIRTFRNRMNHCEPLCFNGHTIDCTNALDIHAKIFKLLTWMNSDLVPFFRSIDNVVPRTNQINRI